MDYKDIANRLRKWANGETCEDCPAKDDLAFCAADAIYDLLSRVEAIRPVSREQVERIRGEWMFKPFYKGTSRGAIECQECKGAFDGSVEFNFCPNCGAPITDEAVEMVMERMEKIK